MNHNCTFNKAPKCTHAVVLAYYLKSPLWKGYKLNERQMGNEAWT